MEFDETPRFWYPHVAFDAWTDFAFFPTKTYGPISIDLRKKRRKEKNFSLSLLSLFLPLSFFLFFFLFLLTFYSFSSLFFILNMCPSLIRVRFNPETIYFFSVQFIINELNLSHFLTSKIFVSLVIYHPENRKNILTVSEFNETFLGH